MIGAHGRSAQPHPAHSWATLRKIKGPHSYPPARSVAVIHSPQHRDMGRELSEDGARFPAGSINHLGLRQMHSPLPWMALIMQLLLLLPTAFFLPPGALAGWITGGKEARAHSKPYMAFLNISVKDGHKRCGGFLIQKDFVLTAAHCDQGKIVVYLGAHNVTKRERSQQRLAVRRKIPHPKYKTWENDLMLLKLKGKAKLTKAVQLVPLPKAGEEVMPRDICNVAGWGNTRARGFSLPSTLQEVNLKVLEADRCTRYPQFVPTSMLCVGDPREVEKSSFQGDSGGPLVCDGTAQGIVSFGKDDGSPPGCSPGSRRTSPGSRKQ
ncbi:mast cell protease 1A-like isoform X1 [Mauremys mutica]|uniref:mast cell protease 1A-like isoform X1 n=1 Tax=Mauremys mutica TaxID=74926 RepID=UPI001D161E15|nr:mast cell protease 1A-like isoform X1 [Mauremys mutica]